MQHDRDIYIFVQGQPTPINEIPSSGSFKYIGKAILSVPDKTENKQIYSIHPATFDVNFSDKRLVGSIGGSENGGNITFNADIEKNKIESGIGFDNVRVDGYFYGPNAAELGGTYIKPGSYSGTFGAKRQ
ncbi:hypothetical protein RO21_09120 [[Actinobacillus] muris]|uniref:Transferrin-binding protein B C-lobe/N-lobe beta-barrel domain-containing protein n=1 Tax=Muribacter muris TaxID=67855 RepID=A0A0J5P608_9PAST|nr:transferrin-binding protein-like solute binding protein [Muribacter muris]KMK50909.1 hypothetical protein RO21_09120 [[Actinobacillus] muris] [Muribacter muris]